MSPLPASDDAVAEPSDDAVEDDAFDDVAEPPVEAGDSHPGDPTSTSYELALVLVLPPEAGEAADSNAELLVPP